ncbi:MAG: HDOD domain-containing protein [Parashewanella sp.]
MTVAHSLLVGFLKKLHQDKLILPTLPEQVMEIQSVVNDDNSEIKDIAVAIGKEQALSARVIKVANSSMYRRGVACDSLAGAVARIGLIQIQNIVTSVAVEQIFLSSNEQVRAAMNQVWNKSIEVMATACSLLHLHKQSHPECRLKNDTLMLAGLVHNIGALPIITEAEQFPEEFKTQEELNEISRKLQGPVGVATLKKWDFPEDIILVVERWADITFLTEEVSYVDFIRASAIIAGELKSKAPLAQRLAVFIEKGLPVTEETLASDDYLTHYQSIKQSYE